MLQQSQKVEVDPTEFRAFVAGVKEGIPKLPAASARYIRNLVPIVGWIGRYNLTWFIGDLIAGFSVGFIVLPQGLAQAKIATLPPEYGLYSAFAGLLLYAFFSTGKDATVGPSTVLSLLTAQVIAAGNKDANGQNLYEPVIFAISLAFMTGVYELILGMLRLGIIVDFIPPTVITGFTTGAALTAIIVQLPKLLGIKGIDTNTQPLQFIIRDLLVNLSSTKVDAAFGISCALFLAFLKFARDKWGGRNRIFYFLGMARNGIALVVFLVISWGVTRVSGGEPPHSIVGNIPSGFKTPEVPRLDSDILSHVMGPAIITATVGIVEHIAISRSFGRKGGYTIDPSQEMVALGLTNVLGSFLSGYPATGSFSRSAVNAASGVRTPAAGLITGAIVVLALYTMTPALYYTPEPVLAAIIIVSLSDLISPPSTYIEFWNVSFWDLMVCLTATFVTTFSSIQNGIYSSMLLALIVLLVRLARPYVSLLGKLSTGSHFVSLEELDEARSPPPGVLIFRVEQSITYPNAGYVGDVIMGHVRNRTVFGGEKRQAKDRLWCDDTEERAAKLRKSKSGTTTTTSTLQHTSDKDTVMIHHQPILQAIIFDFSAVASFDIAGYQSLIDLKKVVLRYAGQAVEFHFVNVKPHVRRVVRNMIKVLLEVEVMPVGEGLYQREGTLPKNPDDFLHTDIDEAISATSALKVQYRKSDIGSIA
ncbi:hypothetical protein HK102_006173 [Quaeritorhiza haematococci]|nr:hypothetical protein HK102_006173 [Quaeritorhiza haematococci]